MRDSILKGIGIFVLGFIITLFFARFFSGEYVEHSYFYGIIFSILYLSAVVGVSTSQILKAIKEKQR